MDDSIREKHGLACADPSGSRGQVTLSEGETWIRIDSYSGHRDLTEWQARYLAAKLYRLSRRIRQRREAREASVTSIAA